MVSRHTVVSPNLSPYDHNSVYLGHIFILEAAMEEFTGTVALSYEVG